MPSMLRADSIVNFRKLDDLTDFAVRFPSRITPVVQSTFKEQSPSLLEALRPYPARQAVHPFVWSQNKARNARARRRYFAMIRAGEVASDGEGYQRSGGLAAGYSADIVITEGEVLIFIRNKAGRAYRYTKGALQVPGHAATGWEKDAPKIENWLRDYTVYLISQVRLVKLATTGGAPT